MTLDEAKDFLRRTPNLVDYTMASVWWQARAVVAEDECKRHQSDKFAFIDQMEEACKVLGVDMHVESGGWSEFIRRLKASESNVRRLVEAAGPLTAGRSIDLTIYLHANISKLAAVVKEVTGGA